MALDWIDDTDYSIIEALPEERSWIKFEKIANKWHIKGPTKSFEGKGPVKVIGWNGPIEIAREKLRLVKQYKARQVMNSRQASPYICAYDLYEIIK